MTPDYRPVVADLVPPNGLQGREAEIEALHAFCTGEEAYGWWQGPPWAGKTALLASLALDPPPGVSVICYFISRRSGRNTYTDFTETVLSQLCALTGETLPAGLSIGEREKERIRLLEQAAAKALDDGGRLLLLVDGLDEESPTRLPTIATALPSTPPAGLRIIVTSRSAIPVPPGHPLNQCEPVLLAPSKDATGIRDHALAELPRFLAGHGLREQIVGFLAAAQGGLTADNLGELVGEPPYLIVKELHGSGIVRHQDGASAIPSGAYVLVHEEVVSGALAALGRARIDQVWDRFHAWAQEYRGRGWPQHTPGYLLRQYPQGLAEKQDVDGLTRLVLDGARHSRMLDVTGSDSAAFAEIRAAHQLITESDEPDLRTAYLLARHRDTLAARNASIPSSMPALWLSLGRPERAEALAMALPKDRHDDIYRRLAVAAAEAQNPGQALQFIERIGAPKRVPALADVAQATAAAGDHVTACNLADAVTDPYWRASALTLIAQATAAAGDAAAAREIAGQAAASARALTNHELQASVLSEVAQGMATAGDAAAAREIADQAVDAARSIETEMQLAIALAKVAHAVGAAGNLHTACEIVHQAESIVWSDLPAPFHEFVLPYVVEAAAKVCSPAAAREIADSITNEDLRDRALVLVAKSLAATGDYPAALDVADAVGDPVHHARAQAAVSRAAATASNFRTARKVANSIADPDVRIQTLVDVAQAISAAGDHKTAREIANHVERAARSRSDPTQREKTIAALFAVLVSTGDHATARKIAQVIDDPDQRSSVLVTLAHAMAAEGDVSTAREIADEAQAAAMTIADLERRELAVAATAAAVAATGDHTAARSLARGIKEPDRRASALAAVAQAVAAGGDHPTARTIIAEAQEALQSIIDDYRYGSAQATIAAAMASMGDHTTALELAQSIFPLKPKDTALAAVAEAVAGAGDHAAAAQIATAIDSTGRRASSLTGIARTAVEAGERATARTIAAQAQEAAGAMYDQSERASALGAAAEVMAAAGDRSTGQQLADQADAIIAESDIHPSLRAAALGAVARAMAAAGDHTTAHRIARQAQEAAQSIPDADQRAFALAKVAQSAAAAAEYDVVSALLSEATPEVILGVAKDLVDQDDTRAARVLIVRTWMATNWHKPLLALSVVDRRLLSEIATEVTDARTLQIWDSADDTPRAADMGGFERVLNGMADFVDMRRFQRWLDEALARIARIEIGGQPVGTGFLVGPDLLMTNWHVVAEVADSGQPEAAVALFDNGVDLPRRSVRFADDWQVAHSPHGDVDQEISPQGPGGDTWDFAIVRLAQQVGAQPAGPALNAPQTGQRGYYALQWEPYTFDVAEPVYIIGFPRDDTMLFSVASPSGARLTTNRNRVRYDTNTENGSSGSPVFNRAFRIVALHNSGGKVTGTEAFNQGVPISRIGTVLTGQLDQQADLTTLGLP